VSGLRFTRCSDGTQPWQPTTESGLHQGQAASLRAAGPARVRAPLGAAPPYLRISRTSLPDAAARQMAPPDSRRGDIQVLIARHHDRLTRNAEDFHRLMKICGKSNIKISTYTGGELDLSTASGGFYGFMETGWWWYESAIRSQRVKDAVERNARAGKRTGGGSRPFGYKIIRQDLGEGAPRRYRIVGEELEPAEAEAIKEAATRVLRGESLRSIAMDWNRRGIKTVGGNSTKPKGERADRDRGARLWHGSMIRRVLISPRIAGLRERNGEVVGKAVWPAIIDEATHDRLVGLLKDPSRRPLSYGRPRVHPLAGLVYCGSCGGRLVSYLQPRQARGYGCRKDENPDCEARVRIVAEPLEAYIEGHVIDQWRNPRARRIAQSDDDRLKRIAKITAEMAELQRQKDAFRMKLRREVDLQTFREVTKEIDTALDQLAREHKSLTSERPYRSCPTHRWRGRTCRRRTGVRLRRCWSTRSSSASTRT
jgi:DNA invertase Pin-like site-specific DNA recombinase